MKPDAAAGERAANVGKIMDQWLDLTARLAAATLAGVVLGAPTTARDRIGGIRTHALVTLGAALFCVSARRIASDPAELVRIVAGVATGVGFVGAAAVLKRGGVIVGVATAASIWIGGALGCEIGLGEPLFGLGLAVVVSLLNSGLLLVERWLSRRGPQPRVRAAPRPAEG